MEAFYNIFVGCETGLLKGINADSRTWCNLNSVEHSDRQNEITCMCWNDDAQNQLCFSQRKQSVSVYDTTVNAVSNTMDFSGGTGPFRGLCKVGSNYVTCTESGCLRIWLSSGQQNLEISVGDNVRCMRNNPDDSHLLATGGKENRLKVWNIERPDAPVFTAKNVRNDWLNLAVTEWVTDITFIPHCKQIATATNDHQVRVYDPSSNCRRPVSTVSFGECPITCMCLQAAVSHQLFIGNARGNLALLDLRGKGSVVQQYKGAEGSIRSVCCNTSGSVLASCGLDRYVRLHDVKSHQLIDKFYLKSRMNTMLYSSRSQDDTPIDVDLSQHEQKVEVEGNNDDDEILWSKMAPVAVQHRQESVAPDDAAVIVSKSTRNKKRAAYQSSGKSRKVRRTCMPINDDDSNFS